MNIDALPLKSFFILQLAETDRTVDSLQDFDVINFCQKYVTCVWYVLDNIYKPRKKKHWKSLSNGGLLKMLPM